MLGDGDIPWLGSALNLVYTHEASSLDEPLPLALTPAEIIGDEPLLSNNPLSKMIQRLSRKLDKKPLRIDESCMLLIESIRSRCMVHGRRDVLSHLISLLSKRDSPILADVVKRLESEPASSLSTMSIRLAFLKGGLSRGSQWDHKVGRKRAIVLFYKHPHFSEDILPNIFRFLGSFHL